MPDLLIPGYHIRRGLQRDRATVVKFMQRTYAELYPDQEFAHVAHTVEQYLSAETPLWWVEVDCSHSVASDSALARTENPRALPEGYLNPVACLWMGNAVDQIKGDRHTYIFLLYVIPSMRRQGIGTALMHKAEAWARDRGDRQIGLHVFHANAQALALYDRLGYRPQSILMTKTLG